MNTQFTPRGVSGGVNNSVPFSANARDAAQRRGAGEVASEMRDGDGGERWRSDGFFHYRARRRFKASFLVGIR